MTREGPAIASATGPGRGRRVATWLHARPATQLRLLLAAPLLWLVIVYALTGVALLHLVRGWQQTAPMTSGRRAAGMPEEIQ